MVNFLCLPAQLTPNLSVNKVADDGRVIPGQQRDVFENQLETLGEAIG